MDTFLSLMHALRRRSPYPLASQHPRRPPAHSIFSKPVYPFPSRLSSSFLRSRTRLDTLFPVPRTNFALGEVLAQSTDANFITNSAGSVTYSYLLCAERRNYITLTRKEGPQL